MWQLCLMFEVVHRTCRSALARDGVSTCDTFIDCPDAIAGKRSYKSNLCCATTLCQGHRGAYRFCTCQQVRKYLRPTLEQPYLTRHHHIRCMNARFSMLKHAAVPLIEHRIDLRQDRQRNACRGIAAQVQTYRVMQR